MKGLVMPTTRQTMLITLLQSIGARISEESTRNPQLKSLMLDYKEFKTLLEFYFENRVVEKQ